LQNSRKTCKKVVYFYKKIVYNNPIIVKDVL
jgi:hypothetical protein